MSKPWTEKHRREALRRTYELAAELVRDGRESHATTIVQGAGEWIGQEAMWRDNLDFAFDPARIDREVGRARGLAEGRLVRETRWAVRYGGGYRTKLLDRHEAAKVASLDPEERTVVRVTRIRKAAR